MGRRICRLKCFPFPGRDCTVKIEALDFNQAKREIRDYITAVVYTDPVYCITRTARSRRRKGVKYEDLNQRGCTIIVFVLYFSHLGLLNLSRDLS